MVNVILKVVEMTLSQYLKEGENIFLKARHMVTN